MKNPLISSNASDGNRRPRVRVIIFDIDGTLIDSNDFHAKAWERAFAQHGKPVGYDLIRKHVGEGSDQLLPHFLTRSEMEKLGDAIKTSQKNIFHRDYLAHVKPFPKVRELFQRLRSRGIRIALASSSEKNEVKKFEEIANISDLIERSTSADEVEKSKPHPDVLAAAMDSLGNPKKDAVLVVGDSPYDVIAAGKARLPFAGVLCGGFTAYQLKRFGCHRVFKGPADMDEHLTEVLERNPCGDSFQTR